MPSPDRIRELLDAGHTYETAARQLDIAPGLAYMIDTGRPADRSDGDGRPRLVNPRDVNPMRKPHVMEWVRERAARQLTQPDGQ